jgi:hypothetical protein
MSEVMPQTMYCVEVQPRRASDYVTWRFWCDHCQRSHIHGAGAGHRVAHCDKPGSPYERIGYFIALKEAVMA